MPHRLGSRRQAANARPRGPCSLLMRDQIVNGVALHPDVVRVLREATDNLGLDLPSPCWIRQGDPKGLFDRAVELRQARQVVTVRSKWSHEMQLHQPTVRLALLLRGLNRDSFEELPWQVGRKTVNFAAQAGLVEVEPGSLQRLRPRCRLTEIGVLYREENRYVFD